MRCVAATDCQSRPAQSGTFRDALRDPKVYVLAFIYFAYFCSLNTILLWAPTVLKAVAGQTVSSIGWIRGAISLVLPIGMAVVGYGSDKYLERRWHVALCGFAAAACFLLLPLAVESLVLTVMLLMIASVGIFSVLSLFWTIPSAYLSQSAAAGGLALISSIGSFGGAVSPVMIGAVKMVRLTPLSRTIGRSSDALGPCWGSRLFAAPGSFWPALKLCI